MKSKEWRRAVEMLVDCIEDDLKMRPMKPNTAYSDIMNSYFDKAERAAVLEAKVGAALEHLETFREQYLVYESCDDFDEK